MTANILIPTKLVKTNCGNCGYLGFFVEVEPVNKRIKGKLKQVGKICKIRCGRCKGFYEIVDGCVDGVAQLPKDRKKQVTQADIDKGISLEKAS